MTYSQITLARADGLATPRGNRRSVYVQQQRKVVATHLEAFDFPQMNPNCVDRRDTEGVAHAAG